MDAFTLVTIFFCLLFTVSTVIILIFLYSAFRVEWDCVIFCGDRDVRRFHFGIELVRPPGPPQALYSPSSTHSRLSTCSKAMGNRKISPDMKECALKLWDQGWDIEDIVDTLGISRASLYRWQGIFDQYGPVDRPPSAPKGPTRTITRAILTAVQTLYEHESDLYLDELVLWLGVEHNIAISVSALHETLKRAGLTRKLLHKIAIERDEDLRQQWRDMQASEDFLPDGSQFICLDETSKNELTYARKYGRAYSGDRAELRDVFVRGDRYSLVAALGVDGYIACDVMPGSLDSVDFLEFIQEKVVGSNFGLLYQIDNSFSASTDESIPSSSIGTCPR